MMTSHKLVFWFKKWKRLPVIIVFLSLALWPLIDDFFIPFIIPSAIFSCIALVMIFGRWTLEVQYKALCIRTGFSFLSWKAEIPISKIEKIELQPSKTLRTAGVFPDEIRITGSDIVFHNNYFLSKMRRKKTLREEKHREYSFGASMSDEQKAEVINCLPQLLKTKIA